MFRFSLFSSHTYTHMFNHMHACLSHWCEVTRLSCLQTGHQTGQWTLGHTIRHDSTDSTPHTPTHCTHTDTHWEDSESWALDLTWQQRLLLSLTSDPFHPIVPSSFASPCPSLSHHTNMIEEPLFRQAVPHFLHAHTTPIHMHVHVCSHTQTHIMYKPNLCQTFRCRCKWTWPLRQAESRDERAAGCVLYMSVHHQSLPTMCLTALTFYPSSLSVCVCHGVYRKWSEWHF